MKIEHATSESNRTDVLVPTIKELRAAARIGATVTGESLRAARRSAIDLRSKSDESTASYIKKNADVLKRNAELLIENANLDRALRAAKAAEITLRRLMLKSIS